MLAIANSSGRAGFKVALNDRMKGLAPLNSTQRCQSLINYERSAREWLEFAAHIPFTRLDNSLPCPLLISDAGDGTADCLSFQHFGHIFLDLTRIPLAQ